MGEDFLILPPWDTHISMQHLLSEQMGEWEADLKMDIFVFPVWVLKNEQLRVSSDKRQVLRARELSLPLSPRDVCYLSEHGSESWWIWVCFFKIWIVITLKKTNSFEVVIQMRAEIIPRLSTKCSQLFILGEREEGGEVFVSLI